VTAAVAAAVAHHLQELWQFGQFLLEVAVVLILVFARQGAGSRRGRKQEEQVDQSEEQFFDCFSERYSWQFLMELQRLMNAVDKGQLSAEAVDEHLKKCCQFCSFRRKRKAVRKIAPLAVVISGKELGRFPTLFFSFFSCSFPFTFTLFLALASHFSSSLACFAGWF